MNDMFEIKGKVTTAICYAKVIEDEAIEQINVFHRKDIDPFVFAPITVLYGNNGSGKSTILNIIASRK